PPVVVNDRVFWRHHCQVDRLWSIWQRFSPTPAYAPITGGNLGHNAGDVMVQFSNQANFNTPLNQHPSDVQNHKALGSWYHTDVPEITLSTPSVAFGDVPDQLTTFRPVQFSVRTCQQVTFTITGATGANFSIPASQAAVVLDHEHGADQQTANVYVEFHAVGTLGTPQPA